MKTYRATFNSMVESQLTTVIFEYYVYDGQDPLAVANEEIKKRLTGNYLFKAHLIENIKI